MSGTSPSVAPALEAARLGTCWDAVRDTGPLVQCITNIVVAPLTANVLLASGAVPAMVDNPRESGGFAAASGGLLINMGTPYAETADAMRAAVAGAATTGTPWVLDPIGAGALPWREGVAHELIDAAVPAIIRGNASEIIGLAGLGGGGKGPEAAHATEDAQAASRTLVERFGTVVAVSGPVDWLTDGDRVVRVPHGHEWMTKVTGVGCALGALMAACAAVCDDRLVAAATATTALTLAAETAASTTRGPGSFAVALLDELYLLTGDALTDRVALR